jgi:hypothetical protein
MLSPACAGWLNIYPKFICRVTRVNTDLFLTFWLDPAKQVYGNRRRKGQPLPHEIFMRALES